MVLEDVNLLFRSPLTDFVEQDEHGAEGEGSWVRDAFPSLPSGGARGGMEGTCSALHDLSWLTTNFIAAAATPGTASLPRYARSPGPAAAPPVRPSTSWDSPSDRKQLWVAGTWCPGKPSPLGSEG